MSDRRKADDFDAAFAIAAKEGRWVVGRRPHDRRRRKRARWLVGAILRVVNKLLGTGTPSSR